MSLFGSSTLYEGWGAGVYAVAGVKLKLPCHFTELCELKRQPRGAERQVGLTKPHLSRAPVLGGVSSRKFSGLLTSAGRVHALPRSLIL